MYFLKLCYFVLDKTYKFWSRVLALLTVTLLLTAFGRVVGHLESPNLYDFFLALGLPSGWNVGVSKCFRFEGLVLWPLTGACLNAHDKFGKYYNHHY